jgi:hypothetical protein
LLFADYDFPQTVDRIVAVVNDEVITLTDLRVVEEFILYDKDIKENSGNFQQLILEKLIDQKLVVQSETEEISVEEEELESSLKKKVEEIGSERVESRLEEFGMDLDDLKGYLKEKIIYQKIISQRFAQVNIVSLKELEDYYNLAYVPSQKEKGLEAKPMMEILDSIESSIREEKVKTQVESWISNLRKKADIQIKMRS